MQHLEVIEALRLLNLEGIFFATMMGFLYVISDYYTATFKLPKEINNLTNYLLKADFIVSANDMKHPTYRGNVLIDQLELGI